MAFVAVAIGASLVTGVISSNAASSAAKTQAASADAATQGQLDMFYQTRSDMLPWMQTGKNALADLSALTSTPGEGLLKNFSMEDFTADPGYQFSLEEGQKAIDNSLASIGMSQSGSAVKEAERFSQGLADQTYNDAYARYNQDQTNEYNRLAGIAGTGQTTASDLGVLGQNTANQVAENTIGAGNAIAAGQVGSANAWNNAINLGLSTYATFGEY